MFKWQHRSISCLHLNMSDSKAKRSMVLIRAVWAVGIVLSFAGLLGAQEAIRAGLSSFPADTQQVAYSNFAQLRSSSDYPQIRQHVLYQQLRGFQEFLRSVGVDPERDINEVMLGWRGESPSGPGSFGVATGTFDPDRVRQFLPKPNCRSNPTPALTFLPLARAPTRQVPSLLSSIPPWQPSANCTT